MFEQVGLAAAAMPMAGMSAGGLQAAGRFATPRGSARPLGMAGRRLGALPGRVGPGRSPRRRSGGSASHPLAGADLAPYRRRAAQLATLLESDRALPRLGTRPGPGFQPEPTPGIPPLPGRGAQVRPGPAGRDLERRLGLVRVGLEALVADLESVDAVEGELRPLREVAAELGRVAVPGGSERAELERVRERALAVLRAFATQGVPGGPGAPGAAGVVRGRELGFWKR
jgi:hypothetical protein